MVKSMVNSCLPEFSDFTRVFSPVKVLCNRPLEVLQTEEASLGRVWSQKGTISKEIRVPTTR